MGSIPSGGTNPEDSVMAEQAAYIRQVYKLWFPYDFSFRDLKIIKTSYYKTIFTSEIWKTLVTNPRDSVLKDIFAVCWNNRLK